MELLHDGDILDQIKEYLGQEHNVTPDHCIVTGLLWAAHDAIKTLRAEPEARELACEGCECLEIREYEFPTQCQSCIRNVPIADNYTRKPKEGM